jgi:hypothetical protein
LGSPVQTKSNEQEDSGFSAVTFEAFLNFKPIENLKRK